MPSHTHTPPACLPPDTIKTFGSDAYVRKTLCYVLGEADGLWRLLAGGEGR